MAGSKFISSDSVLGQINQVGSPQYPSQSQLNEGGKSAKDTNSESNSNESNLSKKTTEGTQKTNNPQDPTKGSDGISIGSLKGDAGSIEPPVETRDKNIPNVDVKQEVNPDGANASVEPEEGGWLRNEMKEMARDKMKQVIGDGVSNVNQPEGRESKKTDTKTKPSKKGKVGKIPAIDDNRPKPSIPSAEFTPPTTPNIQHRKTKSPPKINVPKFSMPKMKLR